MSGLDRAGCVLVVFAGITFVACLAVALSQLWWPMLTLMCLTVTLLISGCVCICLAALIYGDDE